MYRITNTATAYVRSNVILKLLRPVTPTLLSIHKYRITYGRCGVIIRIISAFTAFESPPYKTSQWENGLARGEKYSVYK